MICSKCDKHIDTDFEEFDFELELCERCYMAMDNLDIAIAKTKKGTVKNWKERRSNETTRH
jgi:hypothetical protein